MDAATEKDNASKNKKKKTKKKNTTKQAKTNKQTKNKPNKKQNKTKKLLTTHSLRFLALVTRQTTRLVICLTSQQQASVSQGRICSDNLTCCHTVIEDADSTFNLTQSQYTDTGPTSPSADPITPGAWQGSHWSANFQVIGMTRQRKKSGGSGIRTQDLPLSRRTPYHQANEVVRQLGILHKDQSLS